MKKYVCIIPPYFLHLRSISTLFNLEFFVHSLLHVPRLHHHLVSLFNLSIRLNMIICHYVPEFRLCSQPF